MDIELRWATDDDLQAIYRFRYGVYVDEMKRKQLHADHRRKVVIDPLDRSGRTLGAWRDGALVGTVRINLLRDGSIGSYADMYGLSTLSNSFLQACSITTRLMVEPGRRGTRLATLLACETYRYALALGVCTDFIDCNAHLVRFFRQMHELVSPEARASLTAVEAFPDASASYVLLEATKT